MTTFKTDMLSEKYISKESVIKIISDYKNYLRGEAASPDTFEEAIKELISEIESEEQIVELDIKETLNELLGGDNYNDTYLDALDFIATDDMIDHLESKELWPKDPKASDMNDYNFKRFLCDLFETGYHVDDFQLIKSVAVRLDKSWEVM